MGWGERERERGRESETSRARSATEVGDEPCGRLEEGLKAVRNHILASETSCTASCRSSSERDMSRGRTRPHKTAASEREHDLRRDEIAFARDGFTERAQNGHSVPVGSPIGAPNDRGVGNVLSEEGGKVWAVVGQFSLEPGLRAVRASLLCVRRADRDVRGGVRVAKGVGGPEVCAWDEARNLGLSGVVTGLSSGVNECGDRVVAAGWPCPGRNRWRGRRPCPESWSGKQHRVFGRWARRTSSAGGPKPFPLRPQHSDIQQ